MTSCRSCASCERELSAVRLELQAVVRERDQYRDALEALKDACDRGIAGGGISLADMSLVARAALSRERKDQNA